MANDDKAVTEEEWRSQLTADEYTVLREKGTERAFTGEYWNVFEDGIYHCRGCGEALFESTSKFDAGCGWPSFDRAASDVAVKEDKDMSHGMVRTEILCQKCGGHLGHVFPDGPTETGLRYCVNSLSVKLEAPAE
ncbi:peptide-methionine (R)-S-oxide reductase MsrB [Luminiphilus sp. nBUS_16]|uniref:peptide-methionine (R)-S-oxide reductase MsrB n=1 Tax=Luminiphilus sp. nBUS_16 TaxID=3395315 RepID=UPI003EBE0BFA